MTSIILPTHLRAKLGPEMKMDVRWVDVKLTDGTKFLNLVCSRGNCDHGKSRRSERRGNISICIGKHRCLAPGRRAWCLMAVLGSGQ